MYDDGYKRIVNIDVSTFSRALAVGSPWHLQSSLTLASPSILAYLLRRCATSTSKLRPRWNVCLIGSTQMFRVSCTDKRSTQGHEMDIRDLKFETDSFDVAIDKGTFHTCSIRRHTHLHMHPITRYDGRHDDSQSRRLGEYSPRRQRDVRSSDAPTSLRTHPKKSCRTATARSTKCYGAYACSTQIFTA